MHIAALLITLSEITPNSCTGMQCAWSRPTQGGKQSFVTNVDFRQLSLIGYVEHTGPVMQVEDLLQ